jgi:[acyl-carrier-protein] S-malonyltransferase
MAQTAFLFPGQGSQYAGMGQELAAQVPAAAAVFAAADQALGEPLSQLCFSGPEAALTLTANTQPAVLTVSIAAARALAERGVTPDFVAGHSLGEYSALVAAGGMEFKDAVKVVRRRGELMQEAVPAGEGAMAALLGLEAEAVEAICRQSAAEGPAPANAAQGQVCSPANFNAPGQIVIAGHAAAVERACALAGARGGKAIPLPVSAPFHCSLMAPVRETLQWDLWNTFFSELNMPLVTNVDAELIEGAEEARDSLIRQVTAPVQWERSMRELLKRGVTLFIEVGPGRVLSGLLKRVDRAAVCVNVEDMASLEKAVDTWRAQHS